MEKQGLTAKYAAKQLVWAVLDCLGPSLLNLWDGGITLLGNLPVSHTGRVSPCRWKLRQWCEEQSSFPRRSQRQITFGKISPGSVLAWENNTGQVNWGKRQLGKSFLAVRVWGPHFVHLYLVSAEALLIFMCWSVSGILPNVLGTLPLHGLLLCVRFL